MDTTPGTFAIIQVGDAEIDFTAAARLLSKPLEIPVAELVPKLAIGQGILAEGLDEVTAKRCEAWLREGGINVRVISTELLIEPPPPCILKSAWFSQDEMTFASPPDKGVVENGSIKWSEILWLDCVSVQRLSQEEFEDWRIEGDEHAQVVRFKQKRMKVERPVQIDIVSYQPWLWLQIPEESFQFASTKLSMQPTRRENSHHLAIFLGLKSTEARLGPGMKWFCDQTPFRESRLPNETAHFNQLRWQLTNRWLET